MDWKDKRIKAINKVVKNKYDHEKYIQEYCSIINSKANNKKEYKQKEVKNEKKILSKIQLYYWRI